MELEKILNRFTIDQVNGQREAEDNFNLYDTHKGKYIMVSVSIVAIEAWLRLHEQGLV